MVYPIFLYLLLFGSVVSNASFAFAQEWFSAPFPPACEETARTLEGTWLEVGKNDSLEKYRKLGIPRTVIDRLENERLENERRTSTLEPVTQIKVRNDGTAVRGKLVWDEKFEEFRSENDELLISEINEATFIFIGIGKAGNHFHCYKLDQTDNGFLAYHRSKKDNFENLFKAGQIDGKMIETPLGLRLEISPTKKTLDYLGSADIDLLFDDEPKFRFQKLDQPEREKGSGVEKSK